MRFLALQTDIEQMKKQFIVDGEDVLLTASHHYFMFLIPLITRTFFTVAVVSLAIFFTAAFQSFGGMVFLGIVCSVWFLYFFYQLFSAYVDWRYNFIVVSTRKIVIVKHRCCFYQNVFPIHLETISSTSSESQFFGFGHCGILHFNLKEREGGSTKLIDCTYISTPEVVAGIIENAIALLSQKKEEGQKQGEQQEQIDAVKEKAEEQITSAGGTAS